MSIPFNSEIRIEFIAVLIRYDDNLIYYSVITTKKDQLIIRR